MPTPNFERLAQQGQRYNRFHSTGICSPSRAALLTGRNHHRVGMGMLPDLPMAFPGYTAAIGDDAATVYVYCQTGVRAAHAWFVLHDLLGLDHVENYDGSWQEYGNRTDVEIDRS